MAAPAVSVIVCTHDRPGYLAACLAGVAAQRDAPAFETIVVDSATPEPGRTAIAELAAQHGARLVVAEAAGLSRARNLGAAAATSAWLAFIDDDAVPDPDWVAAIARAAAAAPDTAVLGGTIRPRFEAALPAWWPPALVGVLTVLTHDRPGTVGRDLPPRVEPYGANFIIRRDALAAAGGFAEGLGRVGGVLLSNEESLVMRRVMRAGGSVRYDPAVAVTHSIQAERLSAGWLLRRQYFQGVSAVALLRLLDEAGAAWRRAPRELAAVVLFGPLLLLVPRASGTAIARRARAAYALGFLRGLIAPH
jgi:glycosyltransferase involved in cell wall biosynthesis